MLSLPDTWDYSVDGLVSINKESKTAIQSALKELEECGYLVRTKTHDEHGRIDYVYDVYEEPRKETPWTENPVTVNPCTDNVPQLITKESITKESNTKELITNDIGQTKTKRKKFIKPTVQEVEAYCKERNNGIDANRFVDYYEARGWMLGKNHIKDWKACIRTWERNNKQNNVITPRKKKEPENSVYDDDGNFDPEKYWKEYGFGGD